ncbi:MAG: tRNA dihydrouridine synthase DusB [Planctomycetes bacterium]|nr:tRNA dihydrouridine synthase DusB [Planctomycetota bacterium]
MCGCTDLPYRRIARDRGCGLAFTQMVKDDALLVANRRTLQFLDTAAWDRPLGMQLAGRDPARLAEAARRLEALGADVVDVNLGCPVRKIVNDGCGAALLREPAQVGRIVAAMVAAVKIPVTVKMRTGFASIEDDQLFLEVARQAAGAGVAAITVHGRSREQLYRGFSNQEAIAAVVAAVRCPVFGNGDIRAGADAVRMIAATGCHGVMVARGALGNPWLYREVEAAIAGRPLPPRPTVEDRAAALAEHFARAREYYGDYLACILIRKVVHWYSGGLPAAAALRARANGITAPELFAACLEFFREAGHRAAHADADAGELAGALGDARLPSPQPSPAAAGEGDAARPVGAN